MRDGRPGHDFVWGAFFSVLSLGCRGLVDADDFEVGPELDSCAAEVVVESLAPFSNGSDACAQCFSEHCAEEKSRCLADEDCAGGVECMCREPTPAGRSRCDHATADQEVVNEFGACGLRNCGSQCDIGQNWACVGNFDWASCDESGTIEETTLYRDLVSLTPLPDVRVATCGREDALCNAPTHVAFTGEDGVAVSELETLCDPGPFNESGWKGFRKVSEGGVFAQSRYVNRPEVLPRAGRAALASAALVDSLADFLGGPVGDGRGLLSVEAFDCVGLAPSGVTYHVDVEDEETVRWYSNGAFPDTSLDATTDGSHVGGFWNIPSGPVNVWAVNRDGVEIARESVFVVAGEATNILLWPEP